MRNTEQYGNMMCKGFKPGDRVLLKKAFSVLGDDTRDCNNSPHDESVLCEVNRITPRYLELSFFNTVPFFVTEEYNIATKHNDSGEFYITRDFEFALEKMEQLQVKTQNIKSSKIKGRIRLKNYNVGWKTFLLQWGAPYFVVSEPENRTK